MSKIKVNEIEAQSGSTITIPTGQNLVVTDGLATSSLPTVPVSKGGTGLTSLGTANQVIAVNAGATALEFQTASSGGMVQYVEATDNTSESTTSSSFVDSSLSATITPTSASNKILITVQGCTQISGARFRGTIERSGLGDINPNGGTNGIWSNESGANQNVMLYFKYLDTPNTTSAVTYKFRFLNTSGSTSYWNSGSVASTITLIEIDGGIIS